jgi:LPXTG-motif cell wall-anchored protein
MQESLLKRIQKYILEHVHVKRWRRIVGSLACLVVFCTTYALILPALTMTSTTYCGLEEHTHSDECYSEVLVCGQEEMAAHEHTDACYTTQQVLTCGMEESAGHTHTDACYDEAGNLICGMEESEGHTHTDACYTEEKTLTCTESTAGHIHSVDCYEKQLTCGKEEHTHSLACYSDSTADVETADVWERTLPTDLTGVWADDVLSVAKSQLGYTESEKNYEVDDEGNTKGYTRYGDWYGVPYGDWCAMFASFCLNYANVPDTAIPYEASCAKWVEKLTQTEQYQSVDSGYTPNPGDLIFFDNKNAGTANHVGIVTEAVTENDATYVKTIEGNSANKVCENRYLIDNEHILGYGVLPEHCECYDNDGNQICEDGCTCDCHNHTWSEDMQPAAETEAEATADAYSLSYQGEDYEVVLSWNEEGVLPEGTELTAVEISANSEEYQQYYQQTVSALAEQGQLAEGEELPFARYFDVQLTYNGESIEPTGTVNVTVNYADSVLDDGTQVGAVHFTDDGTDILSAIATAGESGTAISHQQDSFSTVGDYGIMTANNGVTGSGATQATVTLTWADGDDNHKDEGVTVNLLKNGTQVNSTELNNTTGKGLSYTFTGLDSSATYSIQYTINGYTTTENVTTSTGTAWQKASSLSNGNTYVLVYDISSGSGSTVNYVGANSSTDLGAGSVTVESDGSLIYNPDTTMQWKYTDSKLQNVAYTNRYLSTVDSNSYFGAKKSTSSPGNISYSGNKIQTGNYYLTGYNGVTTRWYVATSYTLYQKTDVNQLNFTITATKSGSSSGGSTTAGQFEHSKTIDYLGDGVTNPDTNLSGTDYYRLYLDMTGTTGTSEPVDLLIVVDASGSMSTSDVSINGKTVRRDTAVTTFLNGSASSVTSDGFISKFLSVNSENKVSVVRFYGPTGISTSSNRGYSYTKDSDVKLDWTSSSTFVSCANENNNGTNYEAGLLQATSQFSKVKNDGHKKVMIFLSDGVPTFYIDDSGNRQGTGVYANESNVNNCKQPSKDAFDAFYKSNSDVLVYTIGVSGDINGTDLETSKSPEVLEYMAEKGGGEYIGVTSDMDSLKTEMKSLVYPKNVSITDELSQYVRYYGDQPDVKVTMTDKTTGTVTTLYENGAVTSAGSGILASVTYTDADTSETPAGSTGTVTAKFVESYQLDQNCTYTLSFNVETTQTAYNEYASSGYNATGDANTDYGENTTSSNQSGFHSNTHAWVTYTTGGVEHTEDYAHPVVQVITVPDVPSNPDSDGTPTFAHTKTIDSLNDGVDNPDTSLSGTDFYRLYLDMTGKTEPVDLLLVVDGSWSMGVNSDIDNERRDVALGEFLNGTSSDEGFISYFLGLNAENKISVVQFAGDGTYNGDYSNGAYGSLGGNNISKNGWSIDNDSSVLLDWNSAGTIGSSQPDCTAQYNAGTNYEAGLKKATSQLSKVADDGNRKVMVFLSDGAPTYFVIDQNDVGKKSTYSATSNMHETDLSASNVGKRYGHGFGTEYADIKEATKQAFDDFVESNPGVLVYTVGVSKSVTEVTYGNNGEVQSSPEVLQYMAEKGGGNYYAITDSMSTLKEELQSLFYPSNVTITDKLSQYVRYYGDQPDVKVTMKNNSTGAETVLYENGQSTNTTIFSTVKYYDGDTADTPTESTGIVQAVFNPSYKLSPDYTYTLSFNVKSTQTTYNEYRYNGMDYNGVTGDANTDYGTNTTSSNQPGFHSNTIAWVDYTVDKKKYSSLYDHPVVQVNLTGPELPATGGSGTLWYTAGGAVLVGGSLLYGFGRRRKRERRVQ